jgi:putative addiction module component (TIGR02574 family)
LNGERCVEASRNAAPPEVSIDAEAVTAYRCRMSLSNYPDLAKLPRRERLKLAEELWFSGADDSMPATAAQKQLLDARWAAYKAGHAKTISAAELERRLRRK